MDDALGLALFAVYIVGILAISAAITYAVVRIFPTERKPKPEKGESPPSSPSDGGGSLFRRSKRAAT